MLRYCGKTVKELLAFTNDKQKRYINKCQDSKNGTIHFLEEKINCTKIIKLTKQEKIWAEKWQLSEKFINVPFV